MTDKERILTAIIERLSTTQVLCFNAKEETFKSDGKDYVHFGCYNDRPHRVGDLVLGVTGVVGRWKIGWVHQIKENDNYVIREIGSNHLCDYGNERFQRIVGMPPYLLLEQEEYKFRQKVLSAFRKGGEYWYRLNDVEFPSKHMARISIRQAFNLNEAEPFSFTMEWNSRTSIKSILAAMVENGYGVREFKGKTASTQNEKSSEKLIQ